MSAHADPLAAGSAPASAQPAAAARAVGPGEVYPHEIRPALTKGAPAMDKILKKKSKPA